jgi:hypothetical protein
MPFFLNGLTIDQVKTKFIVDYLVRMGLRRMLASIVVAAIL